MKILQKYLFVALASVSASALAQFQVGDRVECDWKSGGKFYPGHVAAKEGGKVFINYDDGGKEHTVAAKCRPLAIAPGTGFSKGARVECRWQNGATWYSGVIAEKTAEQVFIQYDDGDQENTSLDKCRVAASAPANTANAKPGLKVGARVSCNWKNGGTWYPGVIAEKNGDSIFIHYEDGDKEHTRVQMCRAR